MKKYCSGGYCKHADENGMVDTEHFTKSSSSPDGLQSMCTCLLYTSPSPRD